MKSMLLQVFEQIEQSMQKGMPKVAFLDPLSHMRPPRVDLFCFFGRFGAMSREGKNARRPSGKWESRDGQ